MTPWPPLAILASAALLGGCKSEDVVRRDDVSAVIGQYERPQRGVYEIETARLIVTEDGLTFEDAAYRESLLFAESACETPSACKVTGSLCSVTLEKRADGNLVVSAERRCPSLAGVWYTKQNAKLAADALASAARAPIASGASASRSASPSASLAPAQDLETALGLLPDDSEASRELACVHGCNQVAVACVKACKTNDLGCLPRCNGPTLGCAASCRGK